MVTPRERRHDLTKQKILDTARNILVSQGMQGLSMRTLAKEIDYSPSAIYKYYDSKEAILQAIREEGIALSSAMQVEAINQAESPADKLLASGRAYLRFAELYPEHYLLLFTTRDLPPESIQAIFNDPKFTGLPQIIQDGIDQGVFRLPPGYTPDLLGMQAWVTVHGIAMLKLGLLHSAQEEFNPVADQILQTFINSFQNP